LALVVSMLRLQAREHSEPEFAQNLEDATLRVGAIGRVHEQLYQSSDIERFDVGRYIEAICKDLGASFSQCEILVQAQPGIIISADRAISSALIVNELVSNAAKHAYLGEGVGRVWVDVTATSDGNLSISVRDEGGGLPQGFEIGKERGLGARMVRSLAEQLRARARFAWRTRRLASLRRAECQALTESAFRRLAFYERMDAGQRIGALAARTGLDSGALREALSENPDGGAESQRTAIVLLEKVRRQLSH